MHASNYGRGVAFVPVVTSDKYDTERLKNVPYVETIGVLNEEKSELTVFAVNRSLEENIDLDIDLRDFENVKLIEHIVLENNDMKASNTLDNPNNVVPHNKGVTKNGNDLATATLNKHSWNVIRFQV
jgi:alpha-N-arabinofuranosidase